MISVLIDAANLHATLRAMRKEMDFKKLREVYFKKVVDSHGLDSLRISYYSAVLPDGEVNTIRPLLDWLGYNGYTVVTKEGKKWTDPGGRVKVKGNMDVEMAVDIVEASTYSKFIWIFTGDGDFTYAVNRAKQRGCHVTVVSSIQSDPCFIADELRRAADVFIDLVDVVEDLDKPATRKNWQ